MSEEPIAASRNPWFSASVAITAAVAVVGFLIGFVWLPPAPREGADRGLWAAICGAAGLLRNPPAGEPIVRGDHPVTTVSVVPQMLDGATAQAIGLGATLALRCTMCHGARGLSEANSPNLAGQYPVAIYKQLVDFKTGARASAVMAPLVANLTDEEMRDLAAYYAYLPRPSEDMTGEPPRIVADGAPMRGIAPCGACHGELASKAGAAWLGGQPLVYLRGQLEAFATGGRRNDISGQMRNIVRAMTPQEIDAASRYYAGSP